MQVEAPHGAQNMDHVTICTQWICSRRINLSTHPSSFFLMGNFTYIYIILYSCKFFPLILFLIHSKVCLTSSSHNFTGIPLRNGKEHLLMSPSASPTWPTANSDRPGLSMCADELHASLEDSSALASLAMQVQQLLADQALSQ